MSDSSVTFRLIRPRRRPSSFAAVESREVHTGRDRQTARAEGSKRGGAYCETGHHPGMVPAAHCPTSLMVPDIARNPGRPRVEPAVEALVVRFARENTSWL